MKQKLTDSIQSADITSSHDLRLSAWGPYTKRYMGISHIPDVQAGLRFDVSVFPGLYRRKACIPNVMWESDYYPWEAAADLAFFSHRHDILWKDQVYCDIAFCRFADNAVLIRSHCVNRTAETQTLVLHYMASLHFPPRQIYSQEVLEAYEAQLPAGAVWIDGLAYIDLSLRETDPCRNLSPDGIIWGEVRDHGFVNGSGLAQGFGLEASDRVVYRVPDNISRHGVLVLRYRLQKAKTIQIRMTGMLNREFELTGTGDFDVARLSFERDDARENTLAISTSGGVELEIDGLAYVPEESEKFVQFKPMPYNPVPERLVSPRKNALILKYDAVDQVYGLCWGGDPFVIREFLTDDLDCVMRHKIHEHVQKTLTGSGSGHFTNIFLRPILLNPGTEKMFYALLCTGNQDTVETMIRHFDPESSGWETTYSNSREHIVDLRASGIAGDEYRFSQERMAATILTNTVYPVRVRGTWIRHNTPGRWWDCLYTWDSGFIGLGLLELDLQRALDTLNAYLTEPGCRDAAFIHHGSPVPVQFYLFLELWNRTGSRELLEYCYPRLQQYHRFMAGRWGSSSTNTFKSGLLRTWDYFYNSGGWDDYCPQVYVHWNNLESSVTPVIASAQVIRCAKILKMAAEALGKETVEYDEDIRNLSDALECYAWDEKSGYYGYVCHDDTGTPTGILRDDSGENYNRGFDGVYPLLAGICSQEREQRLADHLFAPQELWTDIGITAIDQSAPYYREDGYWNGAVWMAHQWFFWKTMLDLGMTDRAFQIADIALKLWKQEVERTYNCFEHFIVKSGRGAGWHQFGGLSAPVLIWYSAYYRAGRLTTGFDAQIKHLEIGQDTLKAHLRFYGQPFHTPAVIASLNHIHAVRWDGELLPFHRRHTGCVEIIFPAGTRQGVLDVD